MKSNEVCNDNAFKWPLICYSFQRSKEKKTFFVCLLLFLWIEMEGKTGKVLY